LASLLLLLASPPCSGFTFADTLGRRQQRGRQQQEERHEQQHKHLKTEGGEEAEIGSGTITNSSSSSTNKEERDFPFDWNPFVPPATTAPTTPPSGAKIWNSSMDWVSERTWHPQGVISSLPGGEAQWAEVSYMSVTELILLTAVAYPAFVVAILLILTVIVSMLLSPAANATSGRASAWTSKGTNASAGTPLGSRTSSIEGEVWISQTGQLQDLLFDPPLIAQDEMTPFSKGLYHLWVVFASLIPSILVFGMPIVMLGLARPYPQEVFAALTLLTSALIFTNGMYMAVFAGSGLIRMTLQKQVGDRAPRPAQEVESLDPSANVLQWVILPQYAEDVEVVAMALRSIAQSTIAASSIGVVLGMEAREGQAAVDKAEHLKAKFKGQFRDMLATYHPPDLPNDPAGKASNLAWAFKEVVKHAVANNEDLSNIVLTVADADSEFHCSYFNCLAESFLNTNPELRNLRIWQSPVFHVKNYHRQPSPVVVGTMFTCMQELAALCDPNAVRFPYSTYSLSLGLARSVGGWDPEWISEDYHMGIKCFLLTLGATTVEPILVPTVNYTPEADGWFSTVNARWTQAKRHALGFSDMSYYFMMLPLIFSYAVNNRAGNRGLGTRSLQQFWNMATYGITLLIRLINIHVIIGVLSTYTFSTTIIKFTMLLLFSTDRNVNFLFERTSFCPQLLMVTSTVCTIFVSAMFIGVYRLMRERVDGKADWTFQNSAVHWLRNAVAILLWGPIYFLGLGVSIWKAALSVASLKSFEYEVAPKPVMTKTD